MKLHLGDTVIADMVLGQIQGTVRRVAVDALAVKLDAKSEKLLAGRRVKLARVRKKD
jgi:hypothetical protein